MRPTLFIAGIVLAAAASASADVVDIRWSANGHFSHQGTLAAGKFAELCGKLPAGQKVRWKFEANAPVEFNVHYHVGKDVVFPVKLSAVATGSDTLDATIEQDYCWMWSNKSAAPVTLSVTLQR